MIRSTTYSEGGSDSCTVNRTRRGDLEDPLFGVGPTRIGPSVSKGNETGEGGEGVTFGRSSGLMGVSRTGAGVTRSEDTRTVSSPMRKRKVVPAFSITS